MRNKKGENNTQIVLNYFNNYKTMLQETQDKQFKWLYI